MNPIEVDAALDFVVDIGVVVVIIVVVDPVATGIVLVVVPVVVANPVVVVFDSGNNSCECFNVTSEEILQIILKLSPKFPYFLDVGNGPGFIGVGFVPKVAAIIMKLFLILSYEILGSMPGSR